MMNQKEEIEVTQLDVTENGLFAYKGKSVVVYLKESGKRSSTLKNNPDQSAKFHFATCPSSGDLTTLKQSQRHVATTRDDGLFTVYGLTKDKEKEEVEVKLQVCRACLIKANYRNYNEKTKEEQDAIVEAFTVQALFTDLVDLITPSKTGEVITAPSTPVGEEKPAKEVQKAVRDNPLVPVKKTAQNPQQVEGESVGSRLLTHIYTLQLLLRKLKEVLTLRQR